MHSPNADVEKNVDAVESAWSQRFFVILDERSAKDYSCLICEVTEVDGEDPYFFPDAPGEGGDYEEGEIVVQTARVSFRQCGIALCNIDFGIMGIEEFQEEEGDGVYDIYGPESRKMNLEMTRTGKWVLEDGRVIREKRR